MYGTIEKSHGKLVNSTGAGKYKYLETLVKSNPNTVIDKNRTQSMRKILIKSAESYESHPDDEIWRKYIVENIQVDAKQCNIVVIEDYGKEDITKTQIKIINPKSGSKYTINDINSDGMKQKVIMNSHYDSYELYLVTNNPEDILHSYYNLFASYTTNMSEKDFYVLKHDHNEIVNALIEKLEKRIGEHQHDIDRIEIDFDAYNEEDTTNAREDFDKIIESKNSYEILSYIVTSYPDTVIERSDPDFGDWKEYIIRNVKFGDNICKITVIKEFGDYNNEKNEETKIEIDTPKLEYIINDINSDGMKREEVGNNSDAYTIILKETGYMNGGSILPISDHEFFKIRHYHYDIVRNSIREILEERDKSKLSSSTLIIKLLEGSDKDKFLSFLIERLDTYPPALPNPDNPEKSIENMKEINELIELKKQERELIKVIESEEEETDSLNIQLKLEKKNPINNF